MARDDRNDGLIRRAWRAVAAFSILVGLVASVVAGGYAVATFSDDTRLWLMAGSASLLWVAGVAMLAVLYLHHRSSSLPGVTSVAVVTSGASLLAAATAMLAIALDRDPSAAMRAAVAGAVTTGCLAAVAQAAGLRAGGAWQIARWGTVVVAVPAGLVLPLTLLFWGHLADAFRAVGVFSGVLLGLATLVGSMVVDRAGRRDRTAHESTRDTLDPGREIRLWCPRCRAELRGPPGPLLCRGCGFGLEVAIEEPRCACGYPLYRLEGRACPECGRAVESGSVPTATALPRRPEGAVAQEPSADAPPETDGT